MTALKKLNARMLDGARNYAAADRSDPFAFARCIAHIKCGIASVGEGKDQYYDATPTPTTRPVMMGNGRIEKVPHVMYTEVVRP